MNEQLETSAIATIHSIATPAAQGAPGSLQSFLLRSMFWRPAWLADSPSVEHVPFALWLIEAARPRLLVEVGIGQAVSYFAFCQAVDRLRLDTRCHGLYTSGDAKAASPEYEAARSHNEVHHAAFSRLSCCHVSQAPESFSAGSIDLLHLNGTFKSMEDFDAWLPKLSDRALVLIHGTENREPACETADLYAALKRRYPHFDFAQGEGLGLLGVGAQRAPLASQLFAAYDGEHRQGVQDVFARLGRACLDHHEAAKQRARALDLSGQISRQQKQLEEVKQSLEKTKGDLNTRSKELTEARGRLQTQIEQHAVERGQLAERVNLLQEVRVELKEELTRLQGLLDGAQTEVHRRQEEMRSLVADAAESRARVAVIERLLQSREAELAASQSALERVRGDLVVAVEGNQRSAEQLLVHKSGEARAVDQVAALTRQLEDRSIAAKREAAALQHELQALSERQQSALDSIAKLEEKLAARESEHQRAMAAQALVEEGLAQTTRQHRERVEALEAQLQQRDVESAQLRSQLDDERAATRRGEEALACVKQAHAAEMEALQSTLEEREHRCDELREALAGAERAIIAAREDGERQLRAATVRASEAEQALVAVRDELNANETALREARAEACCQIEAYVEKEATHRAREQRYCEEVVRLTKLLGDAEQASKDASQLLEAKTTEVSQARQAAAAAAEKRLQELKASTDKQIAELRAMVKAVTDEKESQAKLLKVAVDEGKRAKVEATSLQGRITKCEGDLAQLAADSVSKAKEAESLWAAKTTAEAVVQTRFVEIAKLTSMLAEVEKQVDIERALNKASRKEMEAANRATKAAQQEADAAQLEAKSLREKLSGLKQSASWKLTAPIRIVGRKFRRQASVKGRTEDEAKVLLESGIFDSNWYLKRYPDVKQSGVDPILHYLRFGAAEKRDPGPKFSTEAYVAAYPDIGELGLNPLLHYVKQGRAEGRIAARAKN